MFILTIFLSLDGWTHDKISERGRVHSIKHITGLKRPWSHYFMDGCRRPRMVSMIFANPREVTDSGTRGRS